MPVFLKNNGSDPTPTPAAPKAKLLTSVNPLLTGRPTSTIGWFNNVSETMADKINTMITTIDGSITANNNQPPLFNYTEYRQYDAQDLITLNQNSSLKIKTVNVHNTQFDIYFTGLQKMTTSVNGRAINILVPSFMTFNDRLKTNSIAFSAESIDPVHISTYNRDLMLEILAELTMTEFYNYLIDFYFKTNHRPLLTSMPTTAKNKGMSDNQIFGAYKVLKNIVTAPSFNAAQLGDFVQELRTHTSDIGSLSQLMLQFPELTFASLSQQFDALEQTFTSL